MGHSDVDLASNRKKPFDLEGLDVYQSSSCGRPQAASALLHSRVSAGADRPTGRIAVMSPTPEPDRPDPAPRQPISRPTPPLTIHNTNEMKGSTAMTTHLNRFVVGPDHQGRSAVLQRGLTNVQSREGFYWRATLWATEETPVDNSIDGDRSQTDGLGARREPVP